MMPGSKARNHDVLAQEWFYGLMTRPDMSIKVERQLHDMQILGRIVGVRSTEQFIWHLLTPTSIYFIIKKNISPGKLLELMLFSFRELFFPSVTILIF